MSVSSLRGHQHRPTPADVRNQQERHRRTDGRFGEQPAAETDLNLDDIVETCPLCGDPADYCPGHGDWNTSEQVNARDLRPGDQVWYDGSERGTVTATKPDMPLCTHVTFTNGDKLLISDSKPTHALLAEPDTDTLHKVFNNDTQLVNDAIFVSRNSEVLTQFATGGYDNVTAQQLAHELAWKAGLTDEADRLRKWMNDRLITCQKCFNAWDQHLHDRGDQCPICTGDKPAWPGTLEPYQVAFETMIDLTDAPVMLRNYEHSRKAM